PNSCRVAPLTRRLRRHPLPARGARELHRRSFSPPAGRRCREAADEGRHPSHSCPVAPLTRRLRRHPLPASGATELHRRSSSPPPAAPPPPPLRGEETSSRRPFPPLAGRRCREAADEGRHPSQFLPSGAPHPAPAAPPSPRKRGEGTSP